MSSEFGDQLRSLRVRYGLTRAQLAQRACVSPRSVAYWETGEFEPREYELRALLKELSVPSADQARLFRLLVSLRGQIMANQIEQEKALNRLSSLPTLGDLLVAIRLRRGLKREQTAPLIGVSLSTLTRWENNRFQPPEDALLRYGLCLGAHPEEVEALQVRRLSPLEPETAFFLEQCEQEVEELREEIERPYSDLIDLRTLSLKHRLWLQAVEHPEALPLLAQVDYHYSHWLFFQDRSLEAGRHAEQALQVLTSHTQPSLLWTKAINIAAASEADKKGDPAIGARISKKWLGRVPQSGLQPYLLCDIALYLARSGQFDTSRNLLRQSTDLLIQEQVQEPHARDYVQVTTARVLKKMGHADKACALMPLPSKSIDVSLFRLYQYATICEMAGERNELERCLSQLNSALAQWNRPRLRRQVDTLMSKIC